MVVCWFAGLMADKARLEGIVLKTPELEKKNASMLTRIGEMDSIMKNMEEELRAVDVDNESIKI